MNFPSFFIHGDETTDSIAAAPRANRFLVYLPFLDPQGGRGLGTVGIAQRLLGPGGELARTALRVLTLGQFFLQRALHTNTSFSSVSLSSDGELEKKLEISSSSRLLS